MNNMNFVELSNNETFDINGGMVWEVIGCVLAIGTAIYGLGYAIGEDAGNRQKYGTTYSTKGGGGSHR